MKSRYSLEEIVMIITVYEPDPDLWVNLRVRKSGR